MNALLRSSIILPTVLAAYISLTMPSLAGGSIGWDQVRAEIAKDDPFMADYIVRNFEVRRVGGGVRVGRDKDGNSLVPGLEVGTRIAPFDFPAKPLGAPGDYTLQLKLEPQSFDDGKTTLWTLTLRKRLPTD